MSKGRIIVITIICGIFFLSGIFLFPFQVHFLKITDKTNIDQDYQFIYNRQESEHCVKLGWSCDIYSVVHRKTNNVQFITSAQEFGFIREKNNYYLILKATGGGSEQFRSFNVYKLRSNGFENISNESVMACEDPLRWQSELIFKHYEPKCSDVGNFWFENATTYKIAL